MRVKRVTVLVALLLLGATPKVEKKAEKPQPPPVKMPEKLQPFVELSRQCAEYEKFVTVTQWQEIWRQTYDFATVDQWRPPQPPAPPENEDPAAAAKRLARTTIPIVIAEKVDGRECAVVDASA